MSAKTNAKGPVRALTVAMDANAAAYWRAVQSSAPGECWDYLVLTAANDKQAEGYRLELALRERAAGRRVPFSRKSSGRWSSPTRPATRPAAAGA